MATSWYGLNLFRNREVLNESNCDEAKQSRYVGKTMPTLNESSSSHEVFYVTWSKKLQHHQNKLCFETARNDFNLFGGVRLYFRVKFSKWLGYAGCATTPNLYSCAFSVASFFFILYTIYLKAVFNQEICYCLIFSLSNIIQNLKLARKRRKLAVHFPIIVTLA